MREERKYFALLEKITRQFIFFDIISIVEHFLIYKAFIKNILFKSYFENVVFCPEHRN